MDRFFAVFNAAGANAPSGNCAAMQAYSLSARYISPYFFATAARHKRAAERFFCGVAQQQCCVLVGQVRLDNRRALLQQLALAPMTSKALSDGELVLAAYKHWGENCAKYLLGDFAFVIWDTTKGQIYATRDPMNMRSLYYLRHHGDLYLSNSIHDLVHIPRVNLSVNKTCIAGWLSGYPQPDASPFTEICALPAGHYFLTHNNLVRSKPFWQINSRYELRYANIGDYKSHFFQLLEQAVADRLPGHAEVVASQMSGGMDSTSITALAHELLAAPDRLQVVSHSYKATQHCDESERVNAMIAHLKLEHVHYLASEKHLQLDFPALYPPAIESPGTVLSPRYHDEMLLLSALDAKVLLTGNGGDEMCWGHSLSYSGRLKRGDYAVLAEAMRGCKEQSLPLLSTMLNLFVKPFVPLAIKQLKKNIFGARNGGHYPSWLPPTASALLEEQTYRAPEPVFDNPALQARYTSWRYTSTLNSVRSYQQVAAEYGISVLHPFFDRRILEFSFAIPDDLWLRENRPKWLLRKCMEQHLPAAVCWHPQKTVFDAYFGKILQSQAGLVRHLLSDTRLQAMGLLDNAAVLATFDACVASPQPSLNVDLLYVLLTQIWFQQYATHFHN